MSQYAIELEHISYAYERKMILHELMLRVKVGEHIGIIGDSGCGKSTLLKLLAGLYEPGEGMVRIEGETIPERIREKVAMVMQQNCLFPLSIKDNITCGHDISEDKVWNACKQAGLAEWIEGLPEGLDTSVGERGNQVSGGQAQRIQIARAICKDAPIILLDEPISALDNDTGALVLRELNKLTQDKTVVHVTHHPESLDSSYVLYRMEGGKLLREGAI